MSKLIGQILAGALVVLVIGLVVVAILAGMVGFLVPIATAGAAAPGFIQSVAIVVLTFLAASVFKSNITINK